VAQYASEPPPFGFNGLGELVYRRTYSRMKADGRSREQWFETVERVVNGAFSMQKEWLMRNQLEWDNESMQQTAQEMYRRIFTMKFLPPGRGLWAMGSALTEERCVLGRGLWRGLCCAGSYRSMSIHVEAEGADGSTGANLPHLSHFHAPGGCTRR
jgi:hypothetical protein